MKALAASSISQYENSVNALSDYYRTIEFGLSACFRLTESPMTITSPQQSKRGENEMGAIVFGSDQGLVGQFNEDVADFAIKTFSDLDVKPKIWVIGERVHARLTDAGLMVVKGFTLPTSVNGIAPLIKQIQIDSEAIDSDNPSTNLYVFHNRPKSGVLYQPVNLRLLPLDSKWQQGIAKIPWPSKNIPESLCSQATTLGALIREYVFISLFRACAESLASENASRLAAMQRAEKNIDELLEKYLHQFNYLRQSTIDEELSDVLAGYELLAKNK